MTAPTPEHIRAALVADYTAGMSQTAAAEKHGVGAATAHRIIKAAGVERGRKFTADVLDAAVDDYIASGESIRVVAKRHPLSSDTLRNELGRRGLTRPTGRTPDHEVRQAAVQEFIAGMSIADIAEKYGAGRSTVSAWLYRAGVSLADRHGESPVDYTHGFVRVGLVWRPVKRLRERTAA